MTTKRKKVSAAGRRIEALRVERGWSVEELAAKAGLPYRSVHATITGYRQTPRIAALRAYARAFDASLSEIKDGK